MAVSRRICRLIILLVTLPLLILGVLLLVATIRALTIEDVDYQYENLVSSGSIDELPESYLEGLPEVFGASLRIPTITTAPEIYDKEQMLVFLDFLRQNFPAVFNSSFINVEYVNTYSILLTIEGSDPSIQPYLLAAHFDVVPVDKSLWSHDPFGGEILPDPKTGELFVWGRGAIDNKINVIGIMMALQYLAATGFQPTRTFYAAFGHDEEGRGADGAGHMSRLLQDRGVTLDFLLDEGLPLTQGIITGVDVPVAGIGVTEKGFMTVALDVEGEGGHSSMPPKDQVAIRLGSALSNLGKYPQPSMFGTGPEAEIFDYVAPKSSWPYKLLFANVWLFKPVLEMVMARSRETNALIRTTTAATMVRIGVKENVVPASGRAIVNHRVHPSQSLEDVLKHDIYAINDPKVKVTIQTGEEAHPISPYGPNVPGWRLIASAVKHLFPKAVAAPGMLVANTDTYHYLNLTSCVYRFAPHIVTKDMLASIHGRDERVSVENFKKAVRWYHRLIRLADSSVPPLRPAKPGHKSGEF